MKTFPMFLKMAGRRVVILGGGEQAAQKARLILRTEARIVLAAPALNAELAAHAAEGRADHHAGPVAPALMEGAALVFVATGCPGADAALHALARAAGAVTNVVDAPSLCDAFTPSIVDRDPVVVAIGTEGTAPVLGRQIKTAVEGMLEPSLGALAAAAGRLRGAAARLAPRRRRDLWAWAFSGAPRRAAPEDAARLIAEAIETGTWDDDHPQVSLVGAGPGSADLITLRGVRRLQEADVVFYDALADPALLDLARRDAERVFVGKRGGARSITQGEIDALLVAALRAGKRIVRLKCGDPGIFARGADELAALRAEGVEPEIVPGVTAASAAAADAGAMLTERGQADALVLTTGRHAQGGLAPGWTDRLSPGTTMAVYMGMGQASQIATDLARAGLAHEVEAEVVERAGSPAMRRLRCRPPALAERIAQEGLAAPAIIFLRRPLRAAARLAAVS